MRAMSSTSLIRAEQVAPALEDVLDALALLAAASSVELEQLREAEDGVQRRAQLVAHAGQELALGPVRPLGQGLRPLPVRTLALELLVGVGQLERPLPHP